MNYDFVCQTDVTFKWKFSGRANGASTKYQNIFFFIRLTIRKLTKFQCIFDVVKLFKIYKMQYIYANQYFWSIFHSVITLCAHFNRAHSKCLLGWSFGRLVDFPYFFFFKYTHIMIQSQQSGHFGRRCVYYIFDLNVYRAKQWSSFISNYMGWILMNNVENWWFNFIQAF